MLFKKANFFIPCKKWTKEDESVQTRAKGKKKYNTNWILKMVVGVFWNENTTLKYNNSKCIWQQIFFRMNFKFLYLILYCRYIRYQLPVWCCFINWRNLAHDIWKLKCMNNCSTIPYRVRNVKNLPGILNSTLNCT